MIVIKVLVQRIIISLTSDLTVYAPQCGLDDSLINVVWKLGEKKISIIAGEFIGHIENDPEYYEGQHEGYGYGDTKEGEGEIIHGFNAAMNMTVENKLFKKRASHWVSYECGPSKTQALIIFWSGETKGKFGKIKRSYVVKNVSPNMDMWF